MLSACNDWMNGRQQLMQKPKPLFSDQEQDNFTKKKITFDYAPIGCFLKTSFRSKTCTSAPDRRPPGLPAGGPGTPRRLGAACSADSESAQLEGHKCVAATNPSPSDLTGASPLAHARAKAHAHYAPPRVSTLFPSAHA